MPSLIRYWIPRRYAESLICPSTHHPACVLIQFGMIVTGSAVSVSVGCDLGFALTSMVTVPI